jgi:hypothetical protein
MALRVDVMISSSSILYKHAKLEAVINGKRKRLPFSHRVVWSGEFGLLERKNRGRENLSLENGAWAKSSAFFAGSSLSRPVQAQ